MLFPPQRSLHAIRDPRRQLVRPLVYRLVRNANRLGRSGNGSTEQLEGLRLQHAAEFNFSSPPSATTVTGILRTMVEETTYAQRLEAAMQGAGVDARALAKHLGVTPNGVKKVLSGGSKELSATNHFEACRFLGVDPLWLMEGVGSEPQLALSSDERQLILSVRKMQPARNVGEQADESPGTISTGGPLEAPGGKQPWIPPAESINRKITAEGERQSAKRDNKAKRRR